MKKLHIWLSIPSGIIITIICLTGAILVFEQEMLEIANPERYFVQKAEGEKIPNDSLVTLVNSQLVNDTIKSARAEDDPTRTVRASLKSAPKSFVYIDPYTAQITGYHNARQGFFHKIMTLHRWLMMKDRALGRIIVGISTIFMMIILVTGFVRWFRCRSYKLKLSGSMASKLFSMHRVLGVYTTIILIACGLTGLMWSFEGYREAVMSFCGITMRQVLAIHTGAWGGLTTKLLTFAAALFGASLPITGYIMYYRRLKRKNSHQIHPKQI